MANYYTTSSLLLAAFLLAKNCQLVEIKQKSVFKKPQFVFYRVYKIKDLVKAFTLVDKYLSEEILVDSRKFALAINILNVFAQNKTVFMKLIKKLYGRNVTLEEIIRIANMSMWHFEKSVERDMIDKDLII